MLWLSFRWSERFESIHVLLEFLASRVDIHGFPAGILFRSQGEVQEQDSEIYTSALYHFGFGYGSRGLGSVWKKSLWGKVCSDCCCHFVLAVI